MFETKLQQKMRLAKVKKAENDRCGIVSSIKPILITEKICKEELIRQKNIKKRDKRNNKLVEKLIIEQNLEELNMMNDLKFIETIERDANRASLIHGIRFTDHAKIRMIERNISVRDVVIGSDDIKVISDKKVIITTYKNGNIKESEDSNHVEESSCDEKSNDEESNYDEDDYVC